MLLVSPAIIHVKFAEDQNRQIVFIVMQQHIEPSTETSAYVMMDIMMEVYLKFVLTVTLFV